ncbi:nascent polypeptide-associated complex subunit alpha, muscle-specific form-like [Ixodes scapularis]
MESRRFPMPTARLEAPGHHLKTPVKATFNHSTIPASTSMKVFESLKRKKMTKDKVKFIPGVVPRTWKEMPQDYDLLTVPVKPSPSLIILLIHFAMWSIANLDNSPVDSLRHLFIDYLNEEVARMMSERHVTKELLKFLEDSVASAPYSVWLPVDGDSSENWVFYRGAREKPKHVVQPLLLTHYQGYECNRAHVVLNMFNGYKGKVFYPYSYTFSHDNRDKTNKVILLQYFILPALTSLTMRRELAEFIGLSINIEKDRALMVNYICESIKTLVYKSVFFYSSEFNQCVNAIANIESRKMTDRKKSKLAQLIEYPSILTDPWVYISGVGLSIGDFDVAEFSRGLFYSTEYESVARETSELMTSLFFYVLYVIIEKRRVWDCRLVVESKNESILAAFYNLISDLLRPFNCNATATCSSVVIRHNMASQEDLNYGRLDNYDTLKTPKNIKALKTFLGFSCVTEYTKVVTKISQKSSRRVFVMHLCNFEDEATVEAFVKKYFDATTLWPFVLGLFIYFSTREDEVLTEELLDLWSKQCPTLLATSMNVANTMMPSRFFKNASIMDTVRTTIGFQQPVAESTPTGDEQRLVFATLSSQEVFEGIEDDSISSPGSAKKSESVQSGNKDSYSDDDELDIATEMVLKNAGVPKSKIDSSDSEEEEIVRYTSSFSKRKNCLDSDSDSGPIPKKPVYYSENEIIDIDSDDDQNRSSSTSSPDSLIRPIVKRRRQILSDSTDDEMVEAQKSKSPFWSDEPSTPIPESPWLSESECSSFTGPVVSSSAVNAESFTPSPKSPILPPLTPLPESPKLSECSSFTGPAASPSTSNSEVLSFSPELPIVPKASPNAEPLLQEPESELPHPSSSPSSPQLELSFSPSQFRTSPSQLILPPSPETLYPRSPAPVPETLLPPVPVAQTVDTTLPVPVPETVLPSLLVPQTLHTRLPVPETVLPSVLVPQTVHTTLPVPETAFISAGATDCTYRIAGAGARDCTSISAGARDCASITVGARDCLPKSASVGARGCAPISANVDATHCAYNSASGGGTDSLSNSASGGGTDSLSNSASGGGTDSLSNSASGGGTDSLSNSASADTTECLSDSASGGGTDSLSNSASADTTECLSDSASGGGTDSLSNSASADTTECLSDSASGGGTDRASNIATTSDVGAWSRCASGTTVCAISTLVNVGAAAMR